MDVESRAVLPPRGGTGVLHEPAIALVLRDRLLLRDRRRPRPGGREDEPGLGGPLLRFGSQLSELGDGLRDGVANPGIELDDGGKELGLQALAVQMLTRERRGRERLGVEGEQLFLEADRPGSALPEGVRDQR
jgi:hypothetical protein